MLPEYAVCKCGAFWRPSLRLVRGQVICQNCADRRHPRAICVTCLKPDLPVQGHHIARRKYHPAVVSLCLNCHARITAAQRDWPPAIAYAVQQGLSEPAAAFLCGAIELIRAAWINASLAGCQSIWHTLALVGPAVAAVLQALITDRMPS